MAKHWTDEHIIKQGDEYVGYDEAGLEYCRHSQRDAVKHSLILYDGHEANCYNAERTERLKAIKSELFDLANSYAGEETGRIAVQLHESVNYINRALRGLNGDQTIDVQPHMIARAMGLHNLEEDT